MMPTPLTHGLVGASLAQLAPAGASRWRLAAALAGLAVLPDLDVLGFHLGVRYGDVLGHRGLSHSLIAALAAGLVASGLCLMIHRQRTSAAVALVGVAVLAAASHGFLDAATDGGRGVGFLLPFVTERYFLPLRPIAVSAIDPSRFLANAGPVLASEARWVLAPLLGISAACRLGRAWRTGAGVADPEAGSRQGT